MNNNSVPEVSSGPAKKQSPIRSPRQRKKPTSKNDDQSTGRQIPHVALSSGEGDPLLQVFHFLYKLQEKGAPMSLLMPQTIIYEHHFPRYWFAVDTQTQSQRQRKLDEERKREQAEMLEITSTLAPPQSTQQLGSNGGITLASKSAAIVAGTLHNDSEPSEGSAVVQESFPPPSSSTATGHHHSVVGLGGTVIGPNPILTTRRTSVAFSNKNYATTTTEHQSIDETHDSSSLAGGVSTAPGEHKSLHASNHQTQLLSTIPPYHSSGGGGMSHSGTLQKITNTNNNGSPQNIDNNNIDTNASQTATNPATRRPLPPAARFAKLPPSSVETLRQLGGYQSTSSTASAIPLNKKNNSTGAEILHHTNGRSTPDKTNQAMKKSASGPDRGNQKKQSRGGAAPLVASLTQQNFGPPISTVTRNKELEIKWASTMTIVRKGGKECDATSIRNNFLVDPSTIPIPLTLRQAAVEMYSNTISSGGAAFLSAGNTSSLIQYANRPEYVGCLAAMRDPTTHEIIIKGMGPRELETFMLRTPDTTVLSRYVHLGSNNTAAAGGGKGYGQVEDVMSRGDRRKPVEGSKVAELTTGAPGSGRRKHEIVIVGWTPGCFSTEMRTCHADLNDFRVPVADRADTQNFSHYKETVACGAMVAQIRDSILRFVAATEQYENKKVLLFRAYFRLDEHNRPWFLFADDFVLKPIKTIQRDLIGEAMMAKLKAEAEDRRILVKYARALGITLSSSQNASSFSASVRNQASLIGGQLALSMTTHYNEAHNSKSNAITKSGEFQFLAGNSATSVGTAEEMEPEEKEILFSTARELLQKIRKEHVQQVSRLTTMRNTNASAVKGEGKKGKGVKGLLGSGVTRGGSPVVARKNNTEGFKGEETFMGPLEDSYAILPENSKAALFKSTVLATRRSTQLGSAMFPSLLSPSQLATAASTEQPGGAGDQLNITRLPTILSRPQSQQHHQQLVLSDPHMMGGSSEINPRRIGTALPSPTLASFPNDSTKNATSNFLATSQTSPRTAPRQHPHLAVYGITEDDLFLLLMASDSALDTFSTTEGGAQTQPSNYPANVVSVERRALVGVEGGGVAHVQSRDINSQSAIESEQALDSRNVHKQVVPKAQFGDEYISASSPTTTPSKSSTAPKFKTHNNSGFSSTVPVDDNGQPLWTVEDQRRHKLTVLRRTLPKHFLSNPDVTDSLLMEVEDQLDQIITNADAKRKQREYQKRQAVALRAQTLSFAANASKTRKALNTPIPALTRTIEDLRCHVKFTECPLEQHSSSSGEEDDESNTSRRPDRHKRNKKQFVMTTTLEEALYDEQCVIIFGDRRFGTLGFKEAVQNAKRNHRKSIMIANANNNNNSGNASSNVGTEMPENYYSNWWWNASLNSSTHQASSGRRSSRTPSPQRTSSINSTRRNSLNNEGGLPRTASVVRKSFSVSPTRRSAYQNLSDQNMKLTSVTPINEIKDFVSIRSAPNAPPPSPRLPYCAEDRFGPFGEILPPLVVPNLEENNSNNNESADRIGSSSSERRVTLNEFEEFRFKVLLLVRLGLIPEKYSTLAKIDEILEVPNEEEEETNTPSQSKFSIILHNRSVIAGLLKDDILLRSRLADEELFPPEIELKPLAAPPLPTTSYFSSSTANPQSQKSAQKMAVESDNVKKQVAGSSANYLSASTLPPIAISGDRRTASPLGSPRDVPKSPNSPTGGRTPIINKSKNVVTQMVQATSKELDAETKSKQESLKNKSRQRQKSKEDPNKNRTASVNTLFSNRKSSAYRRRVSTKDPTPHTSSKSLQPVTREGSAYSNIAGAGSALDLFYDNELSKTRSILRAKNAAVVAREQHYFHRNTSGAVIKEVIVDESITKPNMGILHEGDTVISTSSPKRPRFNFGFEDPVNPYNSEIFGPRTTEVEGDDDPVSPSQKNLGILSHNPEPQERRHNSNALIRRHVPDRNSKSYASMKMSKALGMTGTMRMFLRMERRAGSDSDSDEGGGDGVGSASEDGLRPKSTHFGNEDEQVLSFSIEPAAEEIQSQAQTPSLTIPVPRNDRAGESAVQSPELSFVPKRVHSDLVLAQVTARPNTDQVEAKVKEENKPIRGEEENEYVGSVASHHSAIGDANENSSNSPRIPVETARREDANDVDGNDDEPVTPLPSHLEPATHTAPSSRSNYSTAAVTPTNSGLTPQNNISDPQWATNRAVQSTTTTTTDGIIINEDLRATNDIANPIGGVENGTTLLQIPSSPPHHQKRPSVAFAENIETNDSTTSPRQDETTKKVVVPTSSSSKKGILDFCAAFARRGIPFRAVATKDGYTNELSVGMSKKNGAGGLGSTEENLSFALGRSTTSPSKAKASRANDVLASSTTNPSSSSLAPPSEINHPKSFRQANPKNQSSSVADPLYGINEELEATKTQQGEAISPLSRRPLLPSASNSRGSILHSPASKYRKRGSSVLLSEQRSTGAETLIGLDPRGSNLTTSHHPIEHAVPRSSFSYFASATGMSEYYDADYTDSKRRRRHSSSSGYESPAGDIALQKQQQLEVDCEFASSILASRYYQSIIATLEVDDRVEFDSLCARHDQLMALVDDLSYTIYSKMLSNDHGERQRVFIEAELLPFVYKSCAASLRIVEEVDVNGNPMISSGAGGLNKEGSNSLVARRARAAAAAAAATVGTPALTAGGNSTQYNLLPPLQSPTNSLKPSAKGNISAFTKTVSGEILPVPYSSVAQAIPYTSSKVPGNLQVGSVLSPLLTAPPTPGAMLPPLHSNPMASPLSAGKLPQNSLFLLSGLSSPLVAPNTQNTSTVPLPSVYGGTIPQTTELPVSTRAGSVAELDVYTVTFPHPTYALSREDLLYCGFFPLFAEEEDDGALLSSNTTLALSPENGLHSRRESKNEDGKGHQSCGNLVAMSTSFSPSKRFEPSPHNNKTLLGWFDSNSIGGLRSSSTPQTGYLGSVAPTHQLHAPDHRSTSGDNLASLDAAGALDKARRLEIEARASSNDNPLHASADKPDGSSSPPSLAVYGLHNASFFSDYTVVLTAKRSIMRNVFFGMNPTSAPSEPTDKATATKDVARKAMASSGYRTCRFAIAAAPSFGHNTADQFRKLKQILRRKMDDVEREFLISGGGNVGMTREAHPSSLPGNIAKTIIQK